MRTLLVRPYRLDRIANILQGLTFVRLDAKAFRFWSVFPFLACISFTTLFESLLGFLYAPRSGCAVWVLEEDPKENCDSSVVTGC